VLDSTGFPTLAVPFASTLNVYSFVASVSVPVSDYALRLTQAHSAASATAAARRLQLEAETLQRAADARIALFNWARTKAQVVVAGEAVAQSKAHVDAAKQRLDVGIGSSADVLRLEAQVASAEHLEIEAQSLSVIAEEQLRSTIQLDRKQPVKLGADLLRALSRRPPGDLDRLIQRAMDRRPEIRALQEEENSLKDAQAVARAGYAPRLNAVGNVTVANPNPRAVVQADAFGTSWEVGAVLTWTVNETLLAAPAVAEARGRAAAVAEQRAALRAAIQVEVVTAYAELQKAIASVDAAERAFVAGQASLRTREELFNVGRATGVDLVDAQTEVTRSQLRRVDAKLNVLVGRAKLDHATGEQARTNAR
jgi:outer membrane protein TolC